MSGLTPNPTLDLSSKIARLVEEKGWNQEDFARIANLNRQTAREIMQESGRRLRNVTVSRCAKALGLPVLDLRTQPLERLLSRLNGADPAVDVVLQRLSDQATQPQLLAWLERNPERARQLSSAEIDELLSMQGTGGPLTTFGVDHFIELIERKRKLLHQVQAVAGTEYLDLLEQIVGLLYEKVQPYADRR
jgi:transcriptional regulator with XRE-family HTH domain